MRFYDAVSGALHAEGGYGPDDEVGIGNGTFSGDAFVTCDTMARIHDWPLDPLAWTDTRVPRELMPTELEVYRVGSREERDKRIRAWVDAHVSSRALCAWGGRCIQRRDLDEAGRAFERAVKLRDYEPHGHLGLATVYAQRARAANSAKGRNAEVDAGLAGFDRALALDGAGRAYDPKDTRLNPLRGDKRFAEILKRHGRR